MKLIASKEECEESKEECEELIKAWNNLKRTFITETLLGKILYKFIISTLNILLKICNETDKIRRTLWK